MKKIIFVTGTDTGVGKTVLTGLLLAHLRGLGRDALALKPFCSGSRRDARLLRSLQPGCLTLDEVNPYYYDKPVAPGAASKPAPFADALARIRAVANRCETLLIEGAGGLLAPLGADYTARELIEALRCKVLVVAWNRLGTINHTVLTAESLQDSGVEQFKIVLMGFRKPDPSALTNAGMIRKWLPGVPLFMVPYLGKRAATPMMVKKNAIFLKKVLARLL